MRSTITLLLTVAFAKAAYAWPSAAITPAPGMPQRSAPGQRSAADLDASVARQTGTYTRSKKALGGQLEAFALPPVDGLKDTCYTWVVRLRPGAAWSATAQQGVLFSFQTPTGPGYGGPGVVGPGAVVALGCAKASGRITVSAAPLRGTGAIGTGPYSVELWMHKLSAQEKHHLEADDREQTAQANRFAADQRAKSEARINAACSKCSARFQGCIGAGRSRSSCMSDFMSCRFQEGGPDAMCQP
jgi:hypothetical protein